MQEDRKLNSSVFLMLAIRMVLWSEKAEQLQDGQGQYLFVLSLIGLMPHLLSCGDYDETCCLDVSFLMQQIITPVSSALRSGLELRISFIIEFCPIISDKVICLVFVNDKLFFSAE